MSSTENQAAEFPALDLSFQLQKEREFASALLRGNALLQSINNGLVNVFKDAIVREGEIRGQLDAWKFLATLSFISSAALLIALAVKHFG